MWAAMLGAFGAYEVLNMTKNDNSRKWKAGLVVYETRKQIKEYINEALSRKIALLLERNVIFEV